MIRHGDQRHRRRTADWYAPRLAGADNRVRLPVPRPRAGRGRCGGRHRLVCAGTPMTSGDPRRSDPQERRRCHPRGRSVLSCPPIRSETSSLAAGMAAGRRHHALGRWLARSPARTHGPLIRHAGRRPRRLARQCGSTSHRSRRGYATSRRDTQSALRRARHGLKRRVRRHRPSVPNRQPEHPRSPWRRGRHRRYRSRPSVPNRQPERPRPPRRPPWRLSHGQRHCHRPDARVRNPRRHAVTRYGLRPLSPTS